MSNESTASPKIEDESRTETRAVSSGPLLIRLSPTAVVLARLLNVSRNGFCIAHDHGGLSVGQEVRARPPWGDVPARVVWVRKVDGEILTGFRTD